MFIFNAIGGMLMAFADSVPGVSGGTVAFVMGFYNEFIGSLNSLLSLHSSKEEKKKAFIFLIKLGIGWVLGMILSILFIASVFETYIYNISSLFLGFIVFSIPLIYNEEKETIKGNAKHLIYLVLGAIIVALITYFNPVSGSGGASLSLDHFSLGMAAYVFVAGMIAISAMVLPGISGSTLLLIFGLYATVIEGVKNVLHFNFTALPLLMVFSLGILCGIASVIKGINKLLKEKRSQLIFFIFGLMLGSLYAVVMGPTTLEVPKAAMTFSSFNIFFFIIGGAIILGLEKLKHIISAK